MTKEHKISSRRRKVLGAIGIGISGAGVAGATQMRPVTGSSDDDDEQSGPPASEAGMPQEEAEAYGESNEGDTDGTPASIDIQDQIIEPGSDVVVVNKAFLPEEGYLSIHDAKQRLLGEGDVERRVLESLIGISPLKPAGELNNVPVQLFNRFAPAVEQFGRSGPFAKSQPVIAIPHVNNTGKIFDLREDDNGDLVGDGAFTENVVRDLNQLGAANDLATIFVEGTEEYEDQLAIDFTQSIRENFNQ